MTQLYGRLFIFLWHVFIFTDTTIFYVYTNIYQHYYFVVCYYLFLRILKIRWIRYACGVGEGVVSVCYGMICVCFFLERISTILYLEKNHKSSMQNCILTFLVKFFFLYSLLSSVFRSSCLNYLNFLFLGQTLGTLKVISINCNQVGICVTQKMYFIDQFTNENLFLFE